mgnify:FL=1|tara:strand:- start:396 stop:1196 length:801 start_codon:yes stop_codon:yes gene_type:complete
MISELDINKLKIVDKIQKPYPLIIYSNLLDIENINSLQRSLSDDTTTFDKIVMGNRKTILKGSPNFIKFIKKSNSAKKVFNFFENKDVFDFFYKNLENLNKSKKEYFHPNFKKFKYLKFFQNKNRNFFFKIKNRFLKISSQIMNENKVYCDIDFSMAGFGYEREPHHDKENRILNFLFYINDFDSSDGGNFQIFDYKEKPEFYLRQPVTSNVFELKKIPPKQGHLITFLSTPDSIHGVDKIVSSNKKRYFFYGSYTSLDKVNWKIR